MKYITTYPFFNTFIKKLESNYPSFFVQPFIFLSLLFYPGFKWSYGNRWRGQLTGMSPHSSAVLYCHITVFLKKNLPQHKNQAGITGPTENQENRLFSVGFGFSLYGQFMLITAKPAEKVMKNAITNNSNWLRIHKWLMIYGITFC